MSFKGDFEESDRIRLETIADRVKQLASSDQFKQKARLYDRYSCTSRGNFPDGVNNIEETLAYIDLAQVSIDISFFRANNSVVASTSDNEISFNQVIFANNDDSAVANTLFHESLHALGFRHCNKNNIRLFPKIKRSIPYKFGDFMEELF